ncbi:hypothetical protein [Streptomyces buecherae]|uniref:hypothetical protein n=1 Tax=Streptomyces buecherae TaxID=2763006 RepID=UPI00379EBB9B
MHIEQLRQQEVRRLLGISYTSNDDPAEKALEAVELVTVSGSMVFTSGTDWSLRIEQGSWPELPTWCYPPPCWSFSDIVTSSAKLGRIREVLPLLNRYSELTGARLSFDGGVALSVHAGEQFTMEAAEGLPGGTPAKNAFNPPGTRHAPHQVR